MTDTTSKKKSDLLPRLATAVVGIPVLLGIAFFAPNWGLWVLLSGAAAIGAWEFLVMVLGGRPGADGWAGILGVVVTHGALYWSDDPRQVLGASALTVMAVLVLSLRHADEPARVAPRVGGILAAWAYNTTLFGGLIMLVMATPRTEVAPFQAGWLLLPMFVVWAGDTGAYFAGRAFGRRPLAPRVSPKKTREGAVGGVIASVAGGYLAWALLPRPDEFTAVMVLLFAIPGAILGQIGDLCESMIKRSTGVKDSGTIIYGHGGMLDRVDALIFAAPWFALVRAWFDLP